MQAFRARGSRHRGDGGKTDQGDERDGEMHCSGVDGFADDDCMVGRCEMAFLELLRYGKNCGLSMGKAPLLIQVADALNSVFVGSRRSAQLCSRCP